MPHRVRGEEEEEEKGEEVQECSFLPFLRIRPVLSHFRFHFPSHTLFRSVLRDLHLPKENRLFLLTPEIGASKEWETPETGLEHLGKVENHLHS